MAGVAARDTIGIASTSAATGWVGKGAPTIGSKIQAVDVLGVSVVVVATSEGGDGCWSSSCAATSNEEAEPRRPVLLVRIGWSATNGMESATAGSKDTAAAAG